MTTRAEQLQAIKRGDRAAVEGFIEQTSATDVELLETACMHGHRPIVDLLLSRGFDPNAHTDAAVFAGPLFYAVLTDDAALVERLLRGGAEVCARNASGQTPLHIAVTVWRETSTPESKSRTCEVLLAHGADPNLHDAHGVSAYEETLIAQIPALERVLAAAGGRVEPSTNGAQLAREGMNSPPSAIRFEPREPPRPWWKRFTGG